VEEKSNEIPALIALLDNLNLKNCVITMDAMHTKKKLSTK
jgi:predicted transposase YbfD/YdcC